jgi:hypothetical protein
MELGKQNSIPPLGGLSHYRVCSLCDQVCRHPYPDELTPSTESTM